MQINILMKCQEICFMESFETVKDQKRRDAMLDVLVKANRYFFAGEMNEHIDEIKNMAWLFLFL